MRGEWLHEAKSNDGDDSVVLTQLLIADEPITALDVTVEAQIIELMRNLKNR